MPFFSCNTQSGEVAFPFGETEYKRPKTTKALPTSRQIPDSLSIAKYTTQKGQLINRDQTIALKKPTKIKAGQPRVTENRLMKKKIPMTLNKRHAGIPEKIKARGKMMPASGKVVMAGKPMSKPYMLLEVLDEDNFGFQYISQDQNLPGTIGRALLEDSKGRIWIGTDNGLAMLEGDEMKIYTTQEGLSSNSVYSLLESSTGAIWIGTSGGADVFESGRFIHYGTEEGLSTHIVMSLLESSKGQIWIGTDGGGVDIFESGRFTHYGVEEGLSNNRVMNLLESSMGAIWIGTYGGGVDVYQSDSLVHYGLEEGLSNNRVMSLMESSTGAIWIGTDGGGVDVFEAGTFLNYNTKESLTSNNVISLMETSTGAIWIGSDGGGVDVFESGGFTHYGVEEGLSYNSVMSLLETASGAIWIGTTGGGVNVLHSSRFIHYGMNEGLSNDFVVSLLETTSGAIWIGTYGGGIDVLASGNFLHYGTQEGLSGNHVLSLLESSTGGIWIGTEGGGVDVFESGSFLHYGTEEGLSNNRVSSILESTWGSIWIGTEGGGVNVLESGDFLHYGTEEGLSSNTVMSLLESSSGAIWIGTLGGGVDVFESGKILNYGTEEGLSSNLVYSLLESSTGAIWIGTYGGGLDVFESGTFTHYGIQEGFADNGAVQLAMDSLGNIWAGTGKGLTRFVAKEAGYELTNWNKTHGLKYMDFNGPGNPMLFTKTDEESKKGTMWSGVGQALTAFEPPLDDTLRANLFMTGIDIGQKWIDWSRISEAKLKMNASVGINFDTLFFPNQDSLLILSDFPPDTNWLTKAGIKWNGTEDLTPYHLPLDLELPYDQNHLTFHYSGMKLSEQFDVVYRYMLEGLDKKWSPFTREGKADYRNIPPGIYTFRVRARGRNFLWSEEGRISFVVHAPWWQTWWAKMLWVTIFASILYCLYRIRITGLNQQKNELERIVNERTALLKTKNERIAMQAESLHELNENLEHTVDERTNELILKNQKLSEYAFFNAHNMRVPVANIKGIIQLFGKTNSMEHTLELVDLLRGQSEKLDDVLFDIQKMLEEGDSMSRKKLLSKPRSKNRKK